MMCMTLFWNDTPPRVKFIEPAMTTDGVPAALRNPSASVCTGNRCSGCGTSGSIGRVMTHLPACGVPHDLPP